MEETMIISGGAEVGEEGWVLEVVDVVEASKVEGAVEQVKSLDWLMEKWWQAKMWLQQAEAAVILLGGEEMGEEGWVVKVGLMWEVEEGEDKWVGEGEVYQMGAGRWEG